MSPLYKILRCAELIPAESDWAAEIGEPTALIYAAMSNFDILKAEWVKIQTSMGCLLGQER